MSFDPAYLDHAPVFDQFLRVYSAPAVRPPFPKTAAERTYRLPDSVLQPKSFALAFHGSNEPILTAFGNGEYRNIFSTTADLAAIEAGVAGEINYEGAFKPVPPFSRVSGRIAKVLSLEDVKKEVIGAIVAREPEPALDAPNNLSLTEAFGALYGAVSKSVERVGVFAVSRFQTTENFAAPHFVAIIEYQPQKSSAQFGTFVIAERGGLAFPAPGSAEAEKAPTLGSGGVAAGTYDGECSLYATADQYASTVSVFSYSRSATAQRCIQTLVSKIKLPTSRCMISPNAATSHCGLIAVCCGSEQSWPLDQRRPCPIFTQVLIFARRSHALDAPMLYVQGETVDLPAGRAIHQAGFSKNGNLLGIVSSLDDLRSDLRLDLHHESFIVVRNVDGTLGQKQTWVVAQQFAFHSSVVPPIYAWDRNLADTRTLSFCSFTPFGASNGGRIVAFLQRIEGRVHYVAHLNLIPLAEPEPPKSAGFTHLGAIDSLSQYVDTPVLPKDIADYLVAYSKYIAATSYGGVHGGQWVPYYPTGDGSVMVADGQFLGLDVSDTGIIASGQFLSSVAGYFDYATALGALQGWTGSSSREFVEAPPSEVPDTDGGPTPAVSPLPGTVTADRAFLQRFLHFRKLAAG